jgi:DNA-binding MarR family transcriptional regulator
VTIKEDGPTPEPDLAATMARVLRRLVAAEEPILEAAGLSMWEYIVLDALASSTAMSQRELAERTRRDPTRLGRHLQDLTAMGLTERHPSADRRQLTVGLTPQGRQRRLQVKQGIREMEQLLLDQTLTASQAASFRAQLSALNPHA